MCARNGVVVGALSLVVLALGCAPPAEEEAISAEEYREAANNLVAGWNRAMTAQDADGILALYADGAVAMPPYQPALKGKQAIRSWLTELFAQGKVEFESRLEGFEVAGDYLIGHGTYSLSVIPAEGEPVRDQGKWVDISKWQPDGLLRTVRNIWNSDNPPPGGGA